MSETGSLQRFRLIDRRSSPGILVNEDGAGSRVGWGWIIDGATGVSGGRLTPGASDAAWLAAQIDQTLHNLAPHFCSAEALMPALESAVADAFLPFKPPVPSGDLGPAACLGLVRVHSGPAGLRLSGAFLGDVVGLVPSEEGVVRWTDERAKPFERRTLAALASERRLESGEASDVVRRQIRENRQQLNRQNGYWVVQPERSWAGNELVFETEIEPGQPVVLATDGFMRLVDVFGAYTDAELHAALAAGHASELMERLRALERRDPVAGAYPRVKTHDDATVLVLAVDDA